ncbi:MAG: cytochrome c3 family protein [Verrucomicrobiota bacterium]
MKDQLPSPDFDSSKYERPNQNWVCGWACEGKPCRVGPDAKGNCHATYECKPALELREGETKGRFKCTRPKEFGGPCEHGPQADGICCLSIPRCQPQRSLRSKRGIFTWCVVALTIGGLLLAFFGPARLQFISPGKISTNHSSTECASCHRAAAHSPASWSQAALTADPNPLQFAKLVAPLEKSMTHIDQSCQRCHTHHNFHQPNVVHDFSCSACHQEHLGNGKMPAPKSENCIACHGDAEVMQASFEKGKTLSPATFDYRVAHAEILFKTPRPERGYTQVFHSFATDHPEFQIHAQNLKDPNMLKFNHRLHLGESVRTKVGGELECATCHKADSFGEFHQKISFESNCRECHSLQFDKHNPDLQLPHGNPEAVRAFLRSLEIQYADLGRKKGVTEERALQNFVQTQLQTLREEKHTGEELEQQVFFSSAKKSLDERALYPGCAYCHEVKPRGEFVPAITPPQIFDRWLVRGKFDHGKHLNVSCAECHKVRQSETTEDILLPKKSSCVTCHSPKGGVRNDCATCHGFHSAPTKFSETLTHTP